MEGGLNEGLKVRPPGMEPFESNVTISKDNTDISAEQNLLFVKRGTFPWRVMWHLLVPVH